MTGHGRRRIFAAAIALTIPLVLAVALGEAAVRLFAPQNLTGTWLVGGPQGLILNRAGARASHQYGDRVVTYRINALHQRGPAPLDGTAAVLVLGDSFSFGWLLEEADSAPAVLQSLADRDSGPRRLAFLNASTGGWGLASYVAYLEAFGDAIDPIAVVVFLNATDLSRAVSSGLYRATGGGPFALERRDPSDWRVRFRDRLRAIPGIEWLLTHSHFVQLVRQRAARALAPPPANVGADSANPYLPDAETRAFGEALLRRIKAWCDERGVGLYLVSLYHFNYPPGVYEWLEPVAQAAAIPFLDLQHPIAEAIGGDRASHFIAGDFHPNERTNALVAGPAWAWLRPKLDSDIARHAARP